MMNMGGAQPTSQLLGLPSLQDLAPQVQQALAEAISEAQSGQNPQGLTDLLPFGSGSPAAAPSPSGGSGPSHGSSSHWEQLAQQMAAQRGWTGPQWNAIDQIVTAESGWNPNAVNQGSGAYGIPQILPSAHPGTHLQNDPRGQIAWLLRYIHGRYGDPTQALQFRQGHGWY